MSLGFPSFLWGFHVGHRSQTVSPPQVSPLGGVIPGTRSVHRLTCNLLTGLARLNDDERQGTPGSVYCMAHIYQSRKC